MKLTDTDDVGLAETVTRALKKPAEALAVMSVRVLEDLNAPQLNAR